MLLGPVEAKAGALFPARVVGLLAPQTGVLRSSGTDSFVGSQQARNVPCGLPLAPLIISPPPASALDADAVFSEKSG